MKGFSKIYPLYFCGIFFFAISCASVPKNSFPELQVVSYVDKERYLGKWYEIARYPHWFEEGCFNSTAFYEKLKDDKIKVTNRCRMNGSQGEVNEAIGTAKIVDEKSNSKLKVQFIWPFWGDYWIIDLDKEYQYAIVSEPNRQYLWILSRFPTMNSQLLKTLREKIRNQGFDLTYLKNTPR
tara:strand:- start:393 stop:935 length:543 start_codon:yes stop_codon:yes gene_type:complete